METLSAIIRGDLPPVGNPIVLSKANPGTPLNIDNYHPTWVNSGTSALALALLAAKAMRGLGQNDRPAVIIPAYGCPDLVAACEFAGCQATLVDITSTSWGYDPAALAQALTTHTLAVIGVTFLGIREDWQSLLPLLAAYPNVVTIEDNAQWFPVTQHLEEFSTDFIVFSFGKGKPLSLLGGGALYSRRPLQDINAQLIPIANTQHAKWLLLGKLFLYNQLLNPSLYWFLNHNPIFTPGQTHFKALAAVEGIDSLRLQLLPVNYFAYAKQNTAVTDIYTEHLQTLGFTNRVFPADVNRVKRLLRYPLLCTNKQDRDQLLNALNQNGLGATAMYKRALTQLDCPPNALASQTPLRNAENFADCLITLPTHCGVKPSQAVKITEAVAKIIGQPQQPPQTITFDESK